MTRHNALVYEFVEFIPEQPKDGTLYVCMGLATAVHKCCCGCGNEVVTPLSPTGWKLIFDGETITLHPSIGNWGFHCQSHYWIKNNRVQWAERWSRQRIDAARAHDRRANEIYFGGVEAGEQEPMSESKADRAELAPKKGIWQKLKDWWS